MTLLKFARVLVALLVLHHAAAHGAELAVVIDDVGYSVDRGLRAIQLPGPVTVAVLPFAPNTPMLARRAIESGKDVIVHQPMQPHPAPHVRIEQGMLTLTMADAEFDRTLHDALSAVPGSVGLSNHTGSLLTAHRGSMYRLMQNLSRRGYFFLDSRTTADTVALNIAHEVGVPAVKRDVFLDHDPSAPAVARAFNSALQIARRNGQALLVAHPYRLSLSYLESSLSRLPDDIELVPVRKLALRSVTRPAELARLENPADLHKSPGR